MTDSFDPQIIEKICKLGYMEVDVLKGLKSWFADERNDPQFALWRNLGLTYLFLEEEKRKRNYLVSDLSGKKAIKNFSFKGFTNESSPIFLRENTRKFRIGYSLNELNTSLFVFKFIEVIRKSGNVKNLQNFHSYLFDDFN